MTIMKRHRSIAVLLAVSALASCDYEKNAVQDIVAAPPASSIRFFNFGLNAPGVNFYANDTKMTAITSATGAESTLGVGYGGVGAGGFYSGIEPGQYTLSGRIAATTDKDLPISNLAANIENGKTYSFFLSGRYNTTAKTVDAFIVEDPFPPQIDWSRAHVRFVNAIFNASPMTLYARNQLTGEEIAIGGAAAYKTAGAFTPVPNGVYDLSARYAGATTNVLTRPAVSFSFGQIYTITARGDITIAPTTACAAANITCLDNTTNR